MTLFNQTAGVIQSMEEQVCPREAWDNPEEVVLPDLVAATVAVPPVDPDGQVQVPVEQATHQVVPRGPSCR